MLDGRELSGREGRREWASGERGAVGEGDGRKRDRHLHSKEPVKLAGSALGFVSSKHRVDVGVCVGWYWDFGVLPPNGFHSSSLKTWGHLLRWGVCEMEGRRLRKNKEHVVASMVKG